MNQSFKNQKGYYLQSSPTVENTEGSLNYFDLTTTVVRRLPLIASITISMTALAFFKPRFFPPVYVASFELLPETINVETKVTSIDYIKDREKITEVELDDIQLKILKSPSTMSKAVESLQAKYPQLNYQELVKNLTVEFIRDSQNKKNVLSVSYEHSDKQQVSDVIKALTQTYLDYSANTRSEGIKRGIDVLDLQIPKVSKDVERLENKMQRLRDEYNFIDPDVSLTPIAERTQLINQEQDRVTSELQQMRLKLSNLERELSTQPTTAPTAIDLATPRYQGLLNQLREIDIKLSQKSTIYSDQNAEIQVLKEERQRIISLIEQAAEIIQQKLVNDIQTLENRQRLAQSESAKLRSQLKNWSTVSNDYTKFQQELDIAKTQLNEFTRKKETLLIDAAKQQSPWQLLAPAEEPQNNDISPNNRLLLGSSLGLLLGVGLALMLDKTQKTIYSSAKIEEITNLPVLGHIPYTPKRKQLSLFAATKGSTNFKRLPASDIYRDPDNTSNLAFPDFLSSSTEAFCSFAANLGLLNFTAESKYSEFDTSLKSIAITSAVSGEGKSTVALNLARATASMGRKVLLVDADLRSKVRLTESLGLESAIGLKNILSQHDPSLVSEHIQKSPFDDNLFVLSSGFNELMSYESSLLLASSGMYKLMEELKSNYDLVIYDLCALVGYADVNLLAGKTDGVILVTGLGKIDTTLLTKAVEQLKISNVPVLGIAVNDLVK
ncbi:MAG: AAA family ATPase [Pleurocapsa minor HA4230-MV1]|jgi:capsular exopolysaccharide synthesis family protein|nr:AAA family ATPase [Pleurocapsa minor HA4230-MV1]